HRGGGAGGGPGGFERVQAVAVRALGLGGRAAGRRQGGGDDAIGHGGPGAEGRAQLQHRAHQRGDHRRIDGGIGGDRQGFARRGLGGTPPAQRGQRLHASSSLV